MRGSLLVEMEVARHAQGEFKTVFDYTREQILEGRDVQTLL